jgi:hypothetical protein
MKRYLAFAGDENYPGKAWHDFKGSFDSKEDALTALGGISFEWYHIVDTVTEKIVDQEE